MGKTLKYVSEFSFPSDKGYSGSAGKTMVKGYARGGSCGPMKKADGGMVDDPRRPMMDRTVGEYINAVNRERAMEMADMMAAERAAALLRAPRRISQGLRSPRAEMARERAIMGEDAGYKKGGMAMRKQYPTNNGKPMISGPKASPAPKADMLYSKKEVNAKNLLRDGKAPALPHAKGSVNMKSGGPVKKAIGGVMPGGGKMTQSQMQAAAQGGRSPGGGGLGLAGLTQSQMQAAAQGGRPGVSVARMQTTPSPLSQSDLRVMQQAAQQNKGEIRIPPKEIMQQAPGVRPRGAGGPLPQVEVNPNVRPIPSPNSRSSMLQGQIPANPQNVRYATKEAAAAGQKAWDAYQQLPQSQRQAMESVRGQMQQQMAGRGPQTMPPVGSRVGTGGPGAPLPGRKTMGGVMPKPGQVGSATGSTPNIGGVPGRVMAKGGAAKVGKVMREFKAGELHSGSKSGPVVKSRKQAIAIGLSEARRGKKFKKQTTF